MATLMLIIVGILHTSIVIVESKPGAGWNLAQLRFSEQSRAAIPRLANRFPELDDDRRNWGILINGTINDENDKTDYNRPITIPKALGSNSILFKKDVVTKPPSFVNEPSKAKRFLDKLTDVNIGTGSTNNAAEKSLYFCDVQRIKCCMNNLDFSKCSSVRECIRVEDAAHMCDATVLREALKRILSTF